MSRPRDSRRDRFPLMPGIGSLIPGAIEEQEAEGAAAMQQGACEVIPARFNSGSEKDLKKLGFKLGPVDERDPLFREATLPAGWQRKGTGHSMWTYIVDEHGRERLSMFYKAAFYDRDAFINVGTVRGYVWGFLFADSHLVLDDSWATRDAVLKAAEEIRAKEFADAEFWVEHGNDDYAAEHREKVAKCDALLARLNGEAATS
jgi:hypothetical protein